jgi:phosphoenolpyruvate-protein kinase (PTS system EI component)
MSEKALTLIIHGTPISPGMVQGIIHVHRSLLGPIDVPVAIEQDNVEEEFSRLDTATARISEDLFALAMRVEKENDSRLAQVFGAHQLLLNDSSLTWLICFPGTMRGHCAEHLVCQYASLSAAQQ